jgi:putative MFS transporter
MKKGRNVMTVTNAQATIAARMERVPLFSLHRKLVLVLGIGTFFDGLCS